MQEPTAVLGAALAGGVPPELQSEADRAVGAAIEFCGCSSAAAALERARHSGANERTDDYEVFLYSSSTALFPAKSLSTHQK